MPDDPSAHSAEKIDFIASLAFMVIDEWLLDSDPAIRWQVLRDLHDAPPADVASERNRIVYEGWGARLLAARDPNGLWAGGACFPSGFDGDFSGGQPWTSTLHSLTLLREMGVDPYAGEVRTAIEAVRRNCRWEHAGQRFFDGEVEPCINGRTVAVGAYFGVDVDAIVTGLVKDQLADGGWNCEAEYGSTRGSFHSTICVLEGLLEHERATGGTPASIAARHRGEEYLLERRLARRVSTGELVEPNWLLFSFPTWWHYDLLRGVDYFRTAGSFVDPRLTEAIEHIRSRQCDDGTWLLDRTHAGAVHFPMENGDGRPSRWNTLRALRIMRWSGVETS